MHGALDDTICAIATPPGEGGIGVVRISGLHACDVASQVVRLRSGKSLHDLRTHVMALADVGSPGATRAVPYRTESRPHGVLDEALVVVMRGPHSYTGEDVVEVQCHGGPVVLDQLCRG
jgi:tRNA modification GTPase